MVSDSSFSDSGSSLDTDSSDSSVEGFSGPLSGQKRRGETERGGERMRLERMASLTADLLGD